MRIFFPKKEKILIICRTGAGPAGKPGAQKKKTFKKENIFPLWANAAGSPQLGPPGDPKKTARGPDSRPAGRARGPFCPPGPPKKRFFSPPTPPNRPGARGRGQFSPSFHWAWGSCGPHSARGSLFCGPSGFFCLSLE